MLSETGGLAMTAHLDSLAVKLGITRLANLTGLDRIGYPVVAAIRPKSLSLTVSMGKGATLEQAQTAAIMEAAELYFSERPPGDTITASFGELGEGRAIDPKQFEPMCASETLHAMPLEWVKGKCLLLGVDLWVPWQAVSMDLSIHLEATPRVLRHGSTGLAASFDLIGASLHGLCEVIERDSHNTWNGLSDTARLQTLVDVRASSNADLASLLDRIHDAGLHLFLWDMTGQGSLPCYLAELVDFASDAPTAFAQGVAAHMRTSTAIDKAIAEALQVRLTYISGSRDDLDWTDYGSRYDAVVASRKWLSTLPLQYRKASHDHNITNPDVKSAFNEICQRLEHRGISQVVVVPLSPPDHNLCAVKIIVPGLKDTPEANFFENLRRQNDDG
jgi:YcaO-like protein with predicted kinase domain